MEKPIHICFMNATQFWGGGEKWHYSAAQYFKQEEDVTVSAICSRDSRLAEKLIEDDIKVYQKSFSNISFLFPWRQSSMQQLLEEIEADVIIMNGSIDLKHAAMASRKAGIPVRIYRRGLGEPIRNNARNKRFFSDELTHILTNSKFTASRFNSFDNEEIHRKIYTLYNGIDIDKYDFPKSNKNGIHLGITSRLTQYKRHDHLLGALKILDNFNIILHIAGLGEEMTNLKKMTSRLGIRNSVIFHGFIDDIPPFLEKLDIFVHTCADEAFGFSVIEAMAAGLPVVAYRSGAMPEIIVDEVTGILCEDENIPDLAASMNTLIQSEALRNQYGKAGRDRVKNHFNKRKQFQKLEDMITKWLSDKRA